MSDTLKVVLEQGVDGNPVEVRGSRVTYEVFGADNAAANVFALELVAAVFDVVRKASQAKAANPTG